MQCPQCSQSPLVISERQGVEIDYCARCRGVWLDRGELDKLIERSSRMDHPRDRTRHPTYDRAQPSRKGRSSWLGDIFD